jgi:hypothetical protein
VTFTRETSTPPRTKARTMSSNNNQLSLKGHRPNTARKNRTYAKDRVCASEGCTTKLSRYNARDKCWAHAELRVPRLRGRVVKEAPG